MATKKIFLKNSEEALALLGRQDENIRNIENLYGVQIFARQDAGNGMFTLSVRGSGAKVDKAQIRIYLFIQIAGKKTEFFSSLNNRACDDYFRYIAASEHFQSACHSQKSFSCPRRTYGKDHIFLENRFYVFFLVC